MARTLRLTAGSVVITNFFYLIDATYPAMLIGSLRNVAKNLIIYRAAVFDERRWSELRDFAENLLIYSVVFFDGKRWR